MEYFESTGESHLGDLQVPYLINPNIEPPNNPSSFHAFPAANGWKLHHDYKLQVHPGRNPRQDLAPFLQSWLFFGLVGSTMQVNGQPALQNTELHNGLFLDVRELANAIRRWADWERRRSEGRQVRQAEIAYVLSTARKVVHRNCALDTITKGVGYCTSEIHPQFVPDQLALLLMVLGETLSMVNTRIIEDTTSHSTVPYEDLEGGWGPSRWAFEKMRKSGWCPHYIRLLHHRFEPHAAPLLSAYMTSPTDMTSTLEHQRCTEYACKLKKSQYCGGLQSSDSSCLPECWDAHHGTCEMVGPNMAVVGSILDRNINFDPRRTWRGIPVLRFWPKSSDKSESVELEVHHLKTKDLPNGNFVAIFHVLGDGWGNRRGNELPTCRLRYLKRVIRSIAPGQDLYFWLDTLILPIDLAYFERGGGWARNIAMSQIFEIFRHARYTVVLEDALPCSLEEGSSANMAMTYLNRAWMDRLWTLQTWCSMAGQGDRSKLFGFHEGFPDDAITLGQFGTSTETRIKSFLGIKSISDAYSEVQKSSSRRERTTKHSMLVANAWRVARWKTTSAAAEEMLALATLLNIVSRLLQRDTPTTQRVVDSDVSSRIAFFWKRVDHHFPGAIPAGSIFLSGDQPRLDTPIGFGWAPAPWEATDIAEVQDTSMGWQDHTDLILDEGLLVTFPGFLLQPSCDSLRRQCLGMKGDDTFAFCISDKGQGEWYSTTSSRTGPDSDILAQVAGRDSQLAIIVASEAISEAPARIALLVEIYEWVSQDPEMLSDLPEVTYKCQIIRTIRIRREPTSAKFDGLEIRHLPKTAPWLLAGISCYGAISTTQLPSRSSASQTQGAQICFGEWKSKQQKWIVDGYQAKRSTVMPMVVGKLSTDQDISRVTIDNKASMQDIESRANIAGETSTQSLSLTSQIKKSAVWRHLTGKNSSYPPLKEMRTADAAARLVQVSLLTEPQPHKYRELLKLMGNEQGVSQNSGASIFSSPSSTSRGLWTGAQPVGTSHVRSSSSHGRAVFHSVPTDLRLWEAIVLLNTQAQINDKIGNLPKGAATKSLCQLIHFYAVVLWHSAYKAWESELALLMEANVQRICEAIVQQEASEAVPSQESRRQATRSRQLEPEVDIRRFVVGGTAFEDLLKGLHFIVSDQSLHFAIHVQDEDSILKYIPEDARNTNTEVDSTGLSPMDLAIARVDFLRSTGFPESTISKSLRVVQRLKFAWPLEKLIMSPIISVVVEAAAKQSLESDTTLACGPEKHDYWDLVTELSVLLPQCSPRELKSTVQVYSCEVLELLSAIKSSKSHDDPQGRGKSLTWDPLQIFRDLAATVTITGSADTFELDTCGALLHRFWGDAGLDALRLIAAGASINLFRSQEPSVDNPRPEVKQSTEEMVLHSLFGERGNSILSSSSGEKSLFSMSTGSKSVLVVQDISNDVDLREPLAWACAALRPNSSATLELSKKKTRLSQGSFHALGQDSDVPPNLLVWNLRPIEEMPLERLGSHRCWTALFAPGLVVRHEVDRRWGKGLGMSFEMMVHLSASESCIWIDNEVSTPGQITLPDSQNETSDSELTVPSGGYILGGYRTALVPTAQSNDGTRIQWHLETTDDCDTIVDHTNLESLKRNWLKVQDVSKFKNTTSYIGWYERAEVLLGTDSVSQIPMWSAASPRHKSLHRASLNSNAILSIGSAALGPLSPQLEFGITYNWVSNVQRYKHSDEYSQAIRFERRKTALVVDYGKKRAYLVPKLSLMLHLCRVEAVRSQATPDNTGPETSPPIPAAQPSVDGYRAALEVFQNNEEAIFIGSETAADKTTLRQLFLQVHHDLVKAAGLRESPKRVAILGSKIFATELLGLLERPDAGTPLSEIQDPYLLAWVRMAELADAVLICSGLGAAIRPLTVGNDQECECYELPNDKYLLAAHMECIKVVLERQRSDIEDLGRCGVLDFGKGYKMRLNARRLWTVGNHGRHVSFWKKRGEIIQIIHKEDGVDGQLRKFLGTNGEAHQTTATPHLTGVIVFGFPDCCEGI